MVAGELIGDHVGVNSLPFYVVRIANHRTLHNARVHVDRVFNLGRSNAVSGYVQHIIDTPGDSVVALFVAQATVAREIQAWVR